MTADGRSVEVFNAPGAKGMSRLFEAARTTQLGDQHYRMAIGDGEATYGFSGSQGAVNLEGLLISAPGASREVVFLMMHPSSTLQLLPLPPALAAAGYPVLCMGSRYAKNDTALIMEKVLLDLGAYIRHAKTVWGYRQVVLVGWSLGGLYAREIAKRQPHSVAKVISMGSPFSGSPRANNVWRAYQFITGHSVDAPPVEAMLAVKPPVETVALWSANDGVIAPRCAAGRPGERDRAIPLRCTHMGFTYDAQVIAALLSELETTRI